MAASADFVVQADGAKRSFPFQGDETLEITPLGAGNEVGRSCCLLKFKGKTIMFDCGVHPGYKGEESLPFFDHCNPEEIDLLLITHFHNDHAAAVPYFMTKTGFRGKVYMTYPTIAICKLIWSDFKNVSSISDDQGTIKLYTDKEIEVEHEGIKFTCYNAGHVLGACMFLVSIAGVRILYTGDYSRQEDRHLMAAEMPPFKVNVLVVESTYGVQEHEPRRAREKLFIDNVVNTLRNGGRVLLPVFAIGRAQELLLLLDEHWARNPELQRSFSIYCISGIARKALFTFRTYINQMNARIQRLADIENPFRLPHVKYLNSMQEYLAATDGDARASVVMASPGMLQSGLSRQFLDRWCESRLNTLLITGYSVQGTTARDLLESGQQTHTTLEGREVQCRIRVHEISFSAHADFLQTSQFIDELSPANIVLVHGEQNMMAGLRRSLAGRYEGAVGIWSPQNTETVRLEFPESKAAKVVGAAAVERPRDGLEVRGVVLHRNFQLTVVALDEMAQHTGVHASRLLQRQRVPFSLSWDVVVSRLSRLFDAVTVLHDTPPADAAGGTSAGGGGDAAAASGSTTPRRAGSGGAGGKEEAPAPIQVLDAVTVRRAGRNVVELEWESSPVHDLVADAVLCALLQALTTSAGAGGRPAAGAAGGGTAAAAAADGGAGPEEVVRLAHALFSERYGAVTLERAPAARGGGGGGERLRMTVDGADVVVDVVRGAVECADGEVQKRVEAVLRRVMTCLYPVGRACACAGPAVPMSPRAGAMPTSPRAMPMSPRAGVPLSPRAMPLSPRPSA